MSVKINTLELENVKRIKAVALTPSPCGLTVIGGDNGQGKTSVLDSIAWALGGDRLRPTSPQRAGSVLPPSIHIELSNGLVVERKGKNSDLKVIDRNGNKSGQQLLNEFVETLAINLPKFMQASGKEKADTLLHIIGVGDQLYQLEQAERQVYTRRLEIGRIADQKRKFAQELPHYPDAPPDLMSITNLILQQQAILAQNGENQRKRSQRDYFQRTLTQAQEDYSKASHALAQAEENFRIASASAEGLVDASTQALEENIGAVEATNQKVRVNLDREKAMEDAKAYSYTYETLTQELASIRQEKHNLLDGAKLPLPGLSVDNGELLYNGYTWDGMSSAEQLKVATAIVRSVNPQCGFVLLDKLEQMDARTLAEFGAWLEQEGLQAIATRVSTGDECSIVISDGYGQTTHVATKQPWKEGEF